MPIIPAVSVKPISQKAFGELAYDVMKHVFTIHNEFGRFFEEIVYKRELAARMPGIHLEVPVDVTHHTFSKRYFADVLASASGLFEFKAADAIHPRHRSQTIHYLLLFGLHHGKIINTRPEQVEHEFVNCQSRLEDLRNPVIDAAAFRQDTPGAHELREHVTSLVKDWGAGLDLALYEEALTHCFSGDDEVVQRVPVFGTSGKLAEQSMRLIGAGTALKLTSFNDLRSSGPRFATHATRLLQHTRLEAIQWVNMTPRQITFTTIN